MSQPKRHRAESDSDSEEAKNDAGRTNSTPQRKTIDEGVPSTQPPEPEQEASLPRQPIAPPGHASAIRMLKRDLLDFVITAEFLEIPTADLELFASLVSLLRAHKEAKNVHLSNAYKECKAQLRSQVKLIDE